MRTFRLALGLSAVLCAFGALASPALAKKSHTKPPRILGKFLANYPGGRKITETTPATVKGIGSEEKISLAGGALTIGDEKCKKIKSAGEVDSERSDTFYEVMTFIHCEARAILGENKEYHHKLTVPKFHIGFEFHSNGFVETGEGEAGSVEIEHSAVMVPTEKKGPCVIVIPSQTIPVKAVRKPENEFEAASYETEEVPAKIKRFPTGFQEKLDITIELKKIVSEVVQVRPGCEGPLGSQNKKGEIEAEIEELTIKNGNLGFRDKAEVEAEEKEA